MLSSWTFLPTLLASLLLGSLLNFTLFLNTLVNSALTTTIVGVLKGVVSTVLGFFLLGGVELTALGFLGIVINTTGGVWYSLAKFYEKRAQRSRGGGEGQESEALLPVSTNPGVRP
jgi:solute carrier family 35 protein